MARYTDDQIERLSNNEIQNLSAGDLEQIVARLEEINQLTGSLNTEQARVYGVARRELDRINRELERSEGTLGRIRSGINGITNAIGGINNVVQGGFIKPLNDLAGPWGRVDQAANNFGKHMGANAQSVARLRDESLKFANDVHIGSKYNKSVAEMIQLQETYAKSVGRNLQLTNQQRETLLATSAIMGDKALEFSKKLENLGIGLERSGDIAAKMFNEAQKSGVSFEKTSQYVTENLTKVQNYGFKNGVEGLTAMAKKAAEVNMNIAEAFKVADKIQSGGVQEAIKMGAGLQVLGGNFASFGDPMAMLYQGLNDVEALQDRIVNMFSGYGNIQNGEFKISGANRLLVNQAAQTMGVSQDEMYNMISRQAVRSRVERQMGGRFDNDKELKDLLLNTATLNKNNEAVVNIRGEEKRLSEVTAKDRMYLQDMQKSQSEDIKDIAQILRGYTDVQEGFTKEVENKKASSFSEIGKWTKGIYGWAGKNNHLLEIIKDGVLAMTVAQAAPDRCRNYLPASADRLPI